MPKPKEILDTFSDHRLFRPLVFLYLSSLLQSCTPEQQTIKIQLGPEMQSFCTEDINTQEAGVLRAESVSRLGYLTAEARVCTDTSVYIVMRTTDEQGEINRSSIIVPSAGGISSITMRWNYIGTVLYVDVLDKQGKTSSYTLDSGITIQH